MLNNTTARMTAISSINEIVHQTINYVNAAGDDAVFCATKGTLETPANPDWMDIVEGGFHPATGEEIKAKVSFYATFTVPGQAPVKIRVWAFGEDMVERFRAYQDARQVAILEVKAAKLTTYETDRGGHISMTLMGQVRGQEMVEEIEARPASTSNFAENLFAAMA